MKSKILIKIYLLMENTILLEENNKNYIFEFEIKEENLRLIYCKCNRKKLWSISNSKELRRLEENPYCF